VLLPINTKINTPISIFNAPGHDRSSKFRIYKTSRAHNSETFFSSETHDDFVWLPLVSLALHWLPLGCPVVTNSGTLEYHCYYWNTLGNTPGEPYYKVLMKLM
jgi:hypothetical protein